MAMNPKLAWPLRLVDGHLMVHEQDSLEDVRSCVHLLLSTPVGARPLAPEIGVEDPTFTAGVNADLLAGFVRQYEPRAAIEIREVSDGHGGQRVEVTVELAEDDAPEWEDPDL